LGGRIKQQLQYKAKLYIGRTNKTRKHFKLQYFIANLDLYQSGQLENPQLHQAANVDTLFKNYPNEKLPHCY
jgi:hypothetical protein